MGLISLLPALGVCDVNLRDASFIRTETDFEKPSVRRTYHSRSLWRGLFGFGWCAEFEKSLEFISDREANLSSCDQQKKVKFKKIKNLFQVEYTQLFFNSDGVLVRSGEDRYHNDLQGRPIRIESHRRLLFIDYDLETGFITRIKSNKNEFLEYRFASDNLISVKKLSSREINYKYDDVHNLIEIQDGEIRSKILYQKNKDEVKSQTYSNGCFEHYQYEKLSELQLQSTISWGCQKSKVKKKTFLFTSRRSPQGGLFLWEVKTSGADNDTKYLP